jgi:hypothetical protein
MTWRSRWIAVAIAGAAAAYFVLFRLGEDGPDMPAWDIYALFYPNMLRALDAIRHGGRGLGWNALQNCGQPFFANLEVGLLYPANLLFLLLDSDLALRGVMFFNLTVAGVSAYFLCRTLGLAPAAAVGGALAFELGNASTFMTLWSPQAGGPYAWFPAAMLCCERILRAPSVRRAVALGIVLSLALLPGFPQTVLFAYQLIVLRVVWEVATRRVHRPASVAAVTILGLALPLLLAAVQLIPAFEMARESYRGQGVSLAETSVLGRLRWQDFQQGLVFRSALHNPLLLVPALVAGTAFIKAATRRVAFFYAGAGLLFTVLAFGTSTPLFALYTKLPLGSLFREPVRFMFGASFCLAVLTAFGLDALLSRRDERSRVVPWVAVGLAGLILAGFYGVAPDGLTPLEWVLAGTVVASYLLAAIVPAAAGPMALLVLAAVAVNLVAVPAFTYMRLLDSKRSLFSHAPLFDELRGRLTAQDRIYVAPRYPYFDLMQKSASVFGVPSIQDYGSQTSDRYMKFYLMLRTGRRMRSLFDADYTFFGDALQPKMSRRLLDLVATRYLVVAAEADSTIAAVRPPLRLVRDGSVRAYENTRAFPRALYVPHIQVVPDREQLLWLLAWGWHDLRRIALVESDFPSGFTGVAGNVQDGQVEFVTDEPEHLVIRVDAPEPGFLFLSDQYFAGWHATVDRRPTPILRANYAFRLVEVPRGRSLVEFRYAPASIPIGAAVSGVTVLALGLLMWRTSRR